MRHDSADRLHQVPERRVFVTLDQALQKCEEIILTEAGKLRKEQSNDEWPLDILLLDYVEGFVADKSQATVAAKAAAKRFERIELKQNQEFVLTTLVYYLVGEAPLPAKSSAAGSAGAATFGTGSSGSGGGGATATSFGTSTSSSSTVGGSTSRTGRQQGAISSTYERLLLAHLHAYLPHRQYEVARAQESRASLFLTRWLVLLQPWKAPRLYQWYQSLRSPEPRLEAPGSVTRWDRCRIRVPKALGAQGRGPQRPVDVALLGLEPEMPSGGEAPVPQVPKQFVEDDLAAAVSAYFLLEAILSTPLHVELCLELARHCAGWDRAPGIFASMGRAAQSSGWGNQAAPTAQQLLRQRHAIQALKVLAQVLLCFSDTQLLQVLQSWPNQDIGVWLLEYRGVATLEPPMLPIFEDEMRERKRKVRPQLLILGPHRADLQRKAVQVTWAALLAAASITELQPILAAVSQKLQHSRFQSEEAESQLSECLGSGLRSWEVCPLLEVGSFLGQRSLVVRPADPPSASLLGPLAAPIGATVVEFRGSEWERPIRGGEWERLLRFAYWLAGHIDVMMGRGPLMTPCGPVPQTEWPRVLGNWKVTSFLIVALLSKILAVW
eukprot:Skav221055  [mRNA]  locus=scaffold1448:392601:409746:+ [translate_table: standard]